ncbi:MAG TPA: nucleotide exchange factor GrpE [Tenericutes bacterium]|nr:nucleotide exchange factor GrpE [Mycoplasmatota bacterium]
MKEKTNKNKCNHEQCEENTQKHENECCTHEVHESDCKKKKKIEKEKKCDESNSCSENNELESANDKIKELEESLLRSKADFINFRKRLEDEQSRLLKFCNEDIIKEILPVIDNFERAISLDDNNLEDELSKFLVGFKMIYTNLLSILNKFEVVAIDGRNKPFDPTYHQAVFQEKVEGIESGMVIEVLQKGYLLKGKVIRPAMVKVSE